jgi:hypothetical protein
MPNETDHAAPIQTLSEEGFDEATVDFREPECLTIMQVDEHGIEHLVTLSVAQVRQLLPALMRWQI